MSWIDNLEKTLGFTIPPPPAPVWQPTYDTATEYVTVPTNDGGTQQIAIAENYLVDAATAEHLRAQYDPAGTVVLTTFLSGGGPDTSTAIIYNLRWPNGVTIEAHFLAAMYAQNPNNPAVADAACKAMIAARGAA